MLILITRLLSILTINPNTLIRIFPSDNTYAILLFPDSRYLRHDCQYNLFALKCTFTASFAQLRISLVPSNTGHHQNPRLDNLCSS